MPHQSSKNSIFWLIGVIDELGNYQIVAHMQVFVSVTPVTDWPWSLPGIII